MKSENTIPRFLPKGPFTARELIETAPDGIYAHRNPSCRVIKVSALGETILVFVNKTSFEPFIRSVWEGETFIPTNESLSVSFKK